MKFLITTCKFLFFVLILTIVAENISSMRYSYEKVEYKREDTKKLGLDYSFYHKTDQLYEQMQQVMKTCKVSIKETKYSSFISAAEKKDKEATPEILDLLRYYDISDTSVKTKKQKAFYLTGEHPREMIAPEIVFLFMTKLCTKNTEESKVLKNFDLRIILNANPLGRKRVENGEYCNRGNTKNIDLNRNWDFMFGKKISLTEETPGARAFSEIETRFIKESVKRYNPLVFLSIHSGVFGMFLPYAYDTRKLRINNKEMRTILKNVKQKHCSICSTGTPFELLKYQSSGTCMDYIYDKLKVPYAFAWEVYTNEIPDPELAEYRETKNLEKFGKDRRRLTRRARASSFIEEEKAYGPINPNNVLAASVPTPEIDVNENNLCVKLFNPMDKISYEYYTNNWSKALTYLLEQVDESEKDKKR